MNNKAGTTRRRHRLPGWFFPLIGLVLLLWGGVTVFYRLGASGVRVRVGAAAITFNRGMDVALFKIDDRFAIQVFKEVDHASVVRYGRGTFPFCPLCGLYEQQGSGTSAHYRKGDWIYGTMAGPYGEAINVKTGEVIDVPDSTRPMNEDPPPELKARGLDFAPADKLSTEMAIAGLEPLSAINESCTIFTAAFILVVGLVLLIGLVSLAVGQKQAAA